MHVKVLVNHMFFLWCMYVVCVCVYVIGISLGSGDVKGGETESYNIENTIQTWLLTSW